MTSIRYQIKNTSLIVQEAPAQLIQRSVAKLIWYHLLVVLKRNLSKFGNFKSEFDASFEADIVQHRGLI